MNVARLAFAPRGLSGNKHSVTRAQHLISVLLTCNVFSIAATSVLRKDRGNAIQERNSRRVYDKDQASLERGPGAKPQPGPAQQMAALPRKERLALRQRESLRNPLWIKPNMFFCVNTETQNRDRDGRDLFLFCQEDANEILLRDLCKVLRPADERTNTGATTG